jgi:protein MAK11
VPGPKTKIHHLQFVTGSVLAISTEDGRIVFFDTDAPAAKEDAESIPAFAVIGQISVDGAASRIKEFTILPLSDQEDGTPPGILVAAGSSDGMVRIWSLKDSELSDSKAVDDNTTAKQLGMLLGEYATGNRITCLVGFIMGSASTEEDAEQKGHDDDGSDDESNDSSDDDS